MFFENRHSLIGRPSTRSLSKMYECVYILRVLFVCTRVLVQDGLLWKIPLRLRCTSTCTHILYILAWNNRCRVKSLQLWMYAGIHFAMYAYTSKLSKNILVPVGTCLPICTSADAFTLMYEYNTSTSTSTSSSTYTYCRVVGTSFSRRRCPISL